MTESSEQVNTDFNIVKLGGKTLFVQHNTVISSLQTLLKNSSQSKTPTQYGLKSNQIQTLFDSFYTTTIQEYKPELQIYFAYRFLALNTPEEKRVGILILTKNIEVMNDNYLHDIERILDNDINDWVICDALSNKVIAQLIKMSAECKERVYNWKDSGKLWRMRACCIIFINFANTEEDKCFDICYTCVKSSERFVQLGVGCLLRELSSKSTNRVIDFIYANYRYFTREGLRYSIDKIDTNKRREILDIGKRRNNNAVPSKSPMPSSSPNIPIENPMNKEADIQLKNIMAIDQLQNIRNQQVYSEAYQCVMPNQMYMVNNVMMQQPYRNVQQNTSDTMQQQPYYPIVNQYNNTNTNYPPQN